MRSFSLGVAVLALGAGLETAQEDHVTFLVMGKTANKHAKVDTSKEGGIVGLVTYAATTFLDFETTGNASGPECPSALPKIDGGQTDRPSAR